MGYAQGVWAVIFLMAGLIAATGDATRLLDEGIRAYDAMELDAAQGKLREARAATESNAERARIDMWLAVVELERGNDGGARRHMRNAFANNPRLDVPSALSPRVHALANAVRPENVSEAKEPARPTKPRRARLARVERSPPPPSAVPPELVESAEPPPAEPSVAAAVPPSAPVTEPEPASKPPKPPTTDPPDATGTRPPPPETVDDGQPLPLLMLASAGVGAAATLALLGGVGLGVMAKSVEADAESEKKAEAATEKFQTASTASMAANGLYATSGLLAVTGGVCAAIWWFQAESE
jgi:hypothetical protein